MIEAVVIIALLIFIGVREYLSSQERKKLLNAILARSPREFKELEMIDKTKIELKPESEKPSDLVPLEELGDEEFEKAVLGKKHGK